MGNKAQFRQAVETLIGEEDEIPWSVVARHLSLLGHVEFDFEGDFRWAVCSPVIAWLPREDRDELSGILCGCRTPAFIESLQHYAVAFGCTVEIQPQTEGPDVVRIIVPSTDVGEQLVTKLNISSQMDAAHRIISILPDINSYFALAQEQPEPIGYPTECYDAQQLKWIEATDPNQPGFYRYLTYRREHRLKLPDRPAFDVPNFIGIFTWLRYQKRIALHYEPRDQIFKAPASAVLPPLYGRVAVLCSGFLPRFEYGWHYYEKMPESVALTLLQRLHQREETL